MARPADLIFPHFAALKAQGHCPTCSKLINLLTEFDNELSKREYEISGMCQECQDSVFKGESDG